MGAGGAAIMIPASLRASAEPDVVIVGAGAEGLAAATALTRDRGTVRLLQAADRVGGRAFTERGTFGFPFDHGASWITGADRNPHRALAERYGFDLTDFSGATETLFVGDREPDGKAFRQYEQAFEVINHRIRSAYRAENDVPASTVVPDGPFIATAQNWIGPMYHLAQGYGALVERFTRHLSVDTGTTVEAIEWRRQRRAGAVGPGRPEGQDVYCHDAHGGDRCGPYPIRPGSAGMEARGDP